MVADPPFLAEECLEKTIQTVQYMAKDKIVFCTGTFTITPLYHIGVSIYWFTGNIIQMCSKRLKTTVVRSFNYRSFNGCFYFLIAIFACVFAYTVLVVIQSIILTHAGAVMEPLLREKLGLHRCKFRPQHKHNLSNEFRCFANYAESSLGVDTD